MERTTRMTRPTEQPRMRKQHEDDLRLSIPSVLSAVELVCEQIRAHWRSITWSRCDFRLNWWPENA